MPEIQNYLDGSTEGETQLKDESMNLKTDEWKVFNPITGRTKTKIEQTMTTMTKTQSLLTLGAARMEETFEC